MNDLKIRFVVATRENLRDFHVNTATGRSLALYKFPFVELDLYAENKIGLSELYNQSIEKARNNPAILVFAHDDIHLTDFHWPNQLLNGLSHYGVIGVAGNKRITSNQPGWAFLEKDGKFMLDQRENLSGIVGRGMGFPPEKISVFGKTCQQVKLLDGVFLSSRSETLIKNNIRFDTQFDFHFYDLDFCRQAEQMEVSLGTWSISLVHESPGDFNSAGWRRNKEKYFNKWGNY